MRSSICATRRGFRRVAETKDEAWLGQTLTSPARAFGASEAPEPGDDGWPGTGFGVRESSTMSTG